MFATIGDKEVQSEETPNTDEKIIVQEEVTNNESPTKQKDKQNVSPIPPKKKDTNSTNEKELESELNPKPESTPTSNRDPIKVGIEKGKTKGEKPSSSIPKDSSSLVDKEEKSDNQGTTPKPDSKNDKQPPKESTPSKPKEDKEPEVNPNPTPKPGNPSKPEPEEPKNPEVPDEPPYLSASEAHRILTKSSVFKKNNNEYLLNDDWGVVVNVKVDKEHVGFVYFDGTTYFAAKNTTYEEILELVEGDEEQAELEWQYIQKIIIENEIAVRSAADAVYGEKTEKANKLYKEILEAGKTTNGYFQEF